MIDIFSKIKDIKINCLAENNNKFKIMNFKIPDKKYSIKIIDSLSFLQSNLDSLSKDLDDDLKIVTKQHLLVNQKFKHFPYSYINKNNLDEKELPEKKEFYNQLTMEEIKDEEYENVKLFYKNMKFKN